MKQYRSLLNNSDGIFSVLFSVRSPFVLRSVLVRFSIDSRSVLDRFSFGSRSVLVRFSIDSRSVLDRFSFGSRLILVHPSFILRSFFVRESKIDRRLIEE